jgi:hypothetical protein
MKKIIYGFLFFSAALMAVSCGSNTDEEVLKYTTDKTLAIVKVNAGQLEKKLPKDELLNDKSSKMSKEDKEKLQLLLDAKSNGVDTEKPFYVMADVEGEAFAFTYIAWLNDKAKFQEGFSKISGKKISVNDKNLVYVDEQLIGSIKDDMIILSGALNNPMNSLTGNAPMGKDLGPDFYEGFWNRKATENKAKLDQIEKSFDNEADLSSWVNLYGVINTFSKGYIETLAINKQLIDAAIGFNFNFGEGKIEMKASTFFNEELQKLVKKYYDGKEIDYSLVNNIELDSAKSYAIGYGSLEFLRQFIKDAGFEPMANNLLQSQAGLTLDDITGGLKGTYAFAMFNEVAPAPRAESAPDAALESASADADEPALTDEYGYEDYEDEYGYEDPYAAYNYPTPNVVVALGINGAKAQKLVDLITKNPMFSQYIKTYTNKDILVVSSTEANLDLLKSGKAATNKKLKKQTGITSYSWMGGDDINMALTQIKSKVKVVNIESTGKVKDGNATSEATVTLDKNKKNVLYYILGYE